MINLLLVGAGGAVGAMARYLTGVGYGRLVGLNRPWLATLTVNVLGGFLMGFLVGALALRISEGGERLRLLLAVGVLGGFTTFSSYALDAVMMIQRRDYGAATAYVVGSVVFSILGLMSGLVMARKVLA